MLPSPDAVETAIAKRMDELLELLVAEILILVTHADDYGMRQPIIGNSRGDRPEIAQDLRRADFYSVDLVDHAQVA